MANTKNTNAGAEKAPASTENKEVVNQANLAENNGGENLPNPNEGEGNENLPNPNEGEGNENLPNPNENKGPKSYISKVRIMRADKSIIEKGVNVTPTSDKLQDWLKRGLIEEK